MLALAKEIQQAAIAYGTGHCTGERAIAAAGSWVKAAPAAGGPGHGVLEKHGEIRMLKIEHLTKTYGEKKAVDDLSLHIHAGKSTASSA